MFDQEEDDSSWSMFSLTENLSNSYVDQSKLLSYMSQDSDDGKPIGMQNFRSKSMMVTATVKQVLKPMHSLPHSFHSQHYQPHLQNKHLFGSHASGGNDVVSVARLRWRKAAMKVKFLNDPWADFKIDMYPAEKAIRHRYNAIKKQWIKDECTVKIDPNQFANGAMRACFRLKKLSNFVHKQSWDHAANYVAKCYMDPEIPRERYFDDVKLQMEAKLWAEIFNRYNPPKKIDMFQVSILEFKDRPNSPLYHLEHFIDGQYIKYNSNSGFVDDSHLRCTPQAFSHFTFECSNHDLIVVDIQGVGDLYTDPQIHTAKGTDYGDGNLGIKGFALFFSTHVCNDVCKSLGLTQFDFAPSESKSHERKMSSVATKLLSCAFTQTRGLEEMVVGSPTSYSEYTRRIRCRSDTSMCSDDNNSSSNDLPDICESEGYESSSTSPLLSPNILANQSNSISSMAHHMSSNPIQISSAPRQIPSRVNQHGPPPVNRIRTESSCLDSAFSMDEAMNFFNSNKFGKFRPCCVFAEKNFLANQVDEDDNSSYHRNVKSESLDDEEESTLGKIHLELCKYHEMGRFLTNDSDDFDKDAAFFHLRQAANLGITEALLNMAKIYLQLPHDVLSSFRPPEDDADINMSIGFDYMLQAADKGNKNAIFYVAKAYDTGFGLSKDKSIDWLKAYEYYQKVLNLSDEDSAAGQEPDAGYSELCGDCDPSYTILARLAEMHFNGGFGIEKDLAESASLYTEAAEKAMSCGKGRLANKYYMLSEQASSMADE